MLRPSGILWASCVRFFKLQVWKRKPSFGLNSSGDLTPAPSSFLLRGRRCPPSVLSPNFAFSSFLHQTRLSRPDIPQRTTRTPPCRTRPQHPVTLEALLSPPRASQPPHPSPYHLPGHSNCPSPSGSARSQPGLISLPPTFTIWIVRSSPRRRTILSRPLPTNSHTSFRLPCCHLMPIRLQQRTSALSVKRNQPQHGTTISTNLFPNIPLHHPRCCTIQPPDPSESIRRSTATNYAILAHDIAHTTAYPGPASPSNTDFTHPTTSA